MKKSTSAVLIIILLAMLVGIRAFLEPFFYDPLITYFKNESLTKTLPELNLSHYFLNLLLRYALNSIVSLAIIYLIFRNIKTVFFSLKFYVISFLGLCLVLFILLNFEDLANNLLIFYVRRFLIQPLFLFILVFAFYYQKLQNKKIQNQ
ncbi:exosortase F system-associated protein [Lutibacter sp.]|uniref:exosortase F system-associated membrane protein n=1 Tax=Lutibacter sp. TaxID=1925666 RepID=UPI0034A08310